VKAGKATIDGVSIADKAKNLELGRKIVDMRAANTVGRDQQGDRGTPEITSDVGARRRRARARQRRAPTMARRGGAR
jgi:hypothetical protein